MKKACTLLLLLSVIKTTAQTEMKGMVVDAETAIPLAAASVVITGRRATMTNAEGRFRIVADHPNDRIVVSYVGYKREEIQVAEKETTIYLHPASEVLDEIMVVSTDGLVDRIVQETIRQQKKLRNKESLYLYRQTTFVNGVTSSMVEALFRAQNVCTLRNLRLLFGSYSRSECDAEGNLSHIANLYPLSQIEIAKDTHEIGLNAPVVPLTRNYRQYFDVERSIVNDGEKRFHVLRFKPKISSKRKIFDGTIYVNTDNLVVEKIEGTIRHQDIIANYGRSDIQRVQIQERFIVQYSTEHNYSEICSVVVEADYKAGSNHYRFHSFFVNAGNMKGLGNGIGMRPAYDLRRQIDELDAKDSHHKGQLLNIISNNLILRTHGETEILQQKFEFPYNFGKR